MKARLVLCRGCIAYLGPIADNRPHRHHAGQIVLSLGSPFLLMQAGSTQRLEQAFIPPDTEHALDSRSMPLAVLLFESSALPGIDLEASTPLRALKNLTGANEPPPPANPPRDARIARLMALARGAEGTVRLGELAGRVGLSPGRLTHLFTRCEGIPFKRWLLWDRLLRTVDHLAAGVDLTTAAHAAGTAPTSPAGSAGCSRTG